MDQGKEKEQDLEVKWSMSEEVLGAFSSDLGEIQTLSSKKIFFNSLIFCILTGNLKESSSKLDFAVAFFLII